MKDFYFCVAYKEQNNLNIYRYFEDVRYGNMEEAQNFLKYVQNQEPNKNWKIYKTTFKEMK